MNKIVYKKKQCPKCNENILYKDSDLITKYLIGGAGNLIIFKFKYLKCKNCDKNIIQKIIVM